MCFFIAKQNFFHNSPFYQNTINQKSLLNEFPQCSTTLKDYYNEWPKNFSSKEICANFIALFKRIQKLFKKCTKKFSTALHKYYTLNITVGI